MNHEDLHYGKYKVPLKKLKRIRKELKVTQSMIAEFIGVTTQFFSLLERGENVLSYHNALKIALYFNTTPDELFKEDFINANKYLKDLNNKY